MRKNKGITLVSLVVTIIILIILAGVSINLTLGKNGIITITKQAKENIELAKIEEETALNELYMQIETEGGISGGISYDAIAKLTEFKTAIANYIEEAGGVKPETTADATTFGESIKGILKEATKDATATAEDIANGKTAYVNGELITGVSSSSSKMTIYLSPQSSTVTDISNHQLVYLDVSNYKKLTCSKGTSSGSVSYKKDDQFTNVASQTGTISYGETLDISDYTTIGLCAWSVNTGTVVSLIQITLE